MRKLIYICIICLGLTACNRPYIEKTDDLLSKSEMVDVLVEIYKSQQMINSVPSQSGNQILDIERAWINEKNPSMTFIRANNDTRDLLDNILTILEFQANEQNRYNRFYELHLKKQLSKQAKKELAKLKQNSSEFNWDEF